jgi:hypothetical protein
MDGLGESFGKGYSGDKGDSIMASVTGMVTVTAIAKVTAVLADDRTVQYLLNTKIVLKNPLKW